MTKDEQEKIEALEQRIAQLEKFIIYDLQKKAIYNHASNNINPEDLKKLYNSTEKLKQNQIKLEKYSRELRQSFELDLSAPDINVNLELNPKSIIDAIVKAATYVIDWAKKLFKAIGECLKLVIKTVLEIIESIGIILADMTIISINLPILIVSFQDMIFKLMSLNDYFNMALPPIPTLNLDFDVETILNSSLPTGHADDEHELPESINDDVEIITLENGSEDESSK